MAIVIVDIRWVVHNCLLNVFFSNQKNLHRIIEFYVCKMIDTFEDKLSAQWKFLIRIQQRTNISNEGRGLHISSVWVKLFQLVG